ncbi:ribulose-phosphate 3-epimerase [Nocardia heshunensis]
MGNWETEAATPISTGVPRNPGSAEMLITLLRLPIPARGNQPFGPADRLRAVCTSSSPFQRPAPMIAPSILSADFARLAEELQAIEGADWVHVDVMDNHFVPNLTLGLPIVQSLLKVTDIPMDCHLMIANPERWAPGYAEAGAYNVTFHAEATDNPIAVARDIRAAGAKAGLSVKPNTPIEPYLEILKEFDTLLVMSVEPGFGGQSFIASVLDKAKQVRRLVDAGELRLVVEIDGGINMDTIEQAAEAGVDCFVAGSAVYGTPDPAATVEALRQKAIAIEAASA